MIVQKDAEFFMTAQKDAEFLRWLAARLVNVYGESENTDFVWKLYVIAESIIQTSQTSRWELLKMAFRRK